jgi:hypothetical protein
LFWAAQLFKSLAIKVAASLQMKGGDGAVVVVCLYVGVVEVNSDSVLDVI